MGENWIRECREYLKKLEELASAKDRDRLDLVRSMRTSLSALNHSLWGWIQYVNNPDIMGKFTKEELEEMDRTLNEFTKNFIEYDIKITQLGAKKGLEEIKRRQRERPSRIIV
ncbi:DUF2153 family protein [Candidatus Bathyarchaeota archaeon]|nr:DUF2153 family protein [Candidatus Bathyarchaeota archaeon]